MSPKFRLNAHAIEDEVWREDSPESRLWAYAVFGLAVLAILAAVILT